MSRLLINEPPLIVLPSLAKEIGLNEAIIVQQIQYWLSAPGGGAHIDGHKWVYNTVKQWAEQFPFFSEATVKRALLSLRERGLVVAECLGDNPMDKKLYYRIDYSALEQISQPSRSVCTNLYTETTTDIYKADSGEKSIRPEAKEIITHLNQMAGTSYRPVDSNLRLIEARLKEGATVVDMKRVIDAKCVEWKGGSMEKYLRPQTLFNASKFEQYLGSLGKATDTEPGEPDGVLWI